MRGEIPASLDVSSAFHWRNRPAGTGISATFDHCRFLNSTAAGLQISNGTSASGSNCGASNNGTAGFKAEGANASNMNLLTSVSFNNGQGIQAATGGTIRVGDCQITNNGTGIDTPGGTAASYGTNNVTANSVPGAFNGTPLSQS